MSRNACFDSVSGLKILLEELNGLDSSVKFVEKDKEVGEMEIPYPPRAKAKKENGYGNFLEIIKSIVVTV